MGIQLGIQFVESQAEGMKESPSTRDSDLFPDQPSGNSFSSESTKKGMSRRLAILCLAANLMLPLFFLCPIPSGGIPNPLTPYWVTPIQA
jgi:hypothetical protein